MKKTILIALLLVASFTAFSQEKADTTIQIKLELNQFKQLLYVLEQAIDSKKLSKEIQELLTKNATILDKPKELPKPIK